MLSARYHIASIVAIFLALGIGILIGGSLGQKWMNEAEHNVVELLMAEVKRQTELNKELQNQVGSLQLMYRQIDSTLQRKKILWVQPEYDSKHTLLSFMLQAVGAEWIEETATSSETVQSLSAKLFRNGWPDIILTSDTKTGSMIREALVSGSRPLPDKLPLIIDISRYYPDPHDPEALVNFMMYLRHITVSEAQQYGESHQHRHPGME